MSPATAVNDSSLLAGGAAEAGGGALMTVTSLVPTTTLIQSGPGASEWTPGLIAEAVVRSVLSALTVLVNSLVLVTIRTTPSLRCPTNLVIASLAVTDLLVGLLSPGGLPIELQIVVLPLLCKLGYAGIMALSSVSINHLLFVSIDR